MDFRISKSYIKIAFSLSIAISVLEHFTSILDEYINIDYSRITFIRFSANVVTELSISFIISFFLFLVNYYLLKPFQVREKDNRISLLIAFFISFIIMSFFGHYLFMFKRLIFVGMDSGAHKTAFMFRNFITALAVIVSVIVIRIINQSQQNKLEIQTLKLENLQRQFYALKSQVSPHFLFNSLNSLKTLIRETPETAQEYINHLSAVLRYTLQANENKLVSLNDELRFVESYFFLVKMRYGNNIALKQNISESLMFLQLPPLTLQILLENAIKHNEISKRNPLEISIVETSIRTLQIKNNINEKYSPEPGTGFGLANLVSQYNFLSDNEIIISKNDIFFMVELPLLEK